MKYVIGVDLGGTKIEAALVNEKGKAVKTHRVPTEADKGWKTILKNLALAIGEVKTEKILGIGIGTPGFVHKNEIGANPNVPNLDKALKKFLKNNPNTVIENDGNCFALAEHRWGAGRKAKDMIGLIWGTGIGAGIIMNGRLVRGTAGGAGEVGHIILDYRIKDFCAGCPGTWEHMCSGPNIMRRYHEEGGDEEKDSPGDIWNAKDDASKKVVEETLKYMGMGLGSLVNILNPEIIVVGGGVSNLNVYKELNKKMKEYAIDASASDCRIVKNELGDSAGVLGAAALVFRDL